MSAYQEGENVETSRKFVPGRSLRSKSRRGSHSRSRQQSEEGSSSARKRTWSRGWRSKNSEIVDVSDSEGGQSAHRKHMLQFWRSGRQGTGSIHSPHDNSPNSYFMSATDTPSTRISSIQQEPRSTIYPTPYSRKLTDKEFNAGPFAYDSRHYLKSVDRESSIAPPTAATTEEAVAVNDYYDTRCLPNIDNPSMRPNDYSLPHRGQEYTVGGDDDDSPRSSDSRLRIAPKPFLSTIGTPVDLASWFNPQKWTAQRYRVISTLAPAIHGEVRYVLDMQEKKAVVVKVIHNSAVRPRMRGELENPLVEIGAMTYLHSKEARYPVDLIVKLNGVYQDAKFTYLVTEYCSGGELFRLVIDRKCFNESFVKAIALQLALALLSLHKNGICHRDVSLENTLLKQDKTVRLIDFGQAETIFDANGRERLMSGSAGKDYYRAPEMMQKEYRGPPVDVFALGVEIFIMAIGSPPWQEASDNDPRYRTVTQRADALDISLRKWGKRDKVSDAFVDMLAGIFCSTPAKRPTIEDLLLHPWFAHDPTVWRWVYNKGHSVTIKAQAERLDAYLKTNQAQFFFQNPGRYGSRYHNPKSDHYDGILGTVEPRRRDEDRSATRHRRPYA